MPAATSLILRLESKVKVVGGCWLWTGAMNNAGYAQVHFRGKTCLAHRLIYELLVGPIPQGLDLDHVKDRGCKHRHCINPEHLEPVTRQVNLLRGDTVNARHVAKTHCPKGHGYTEENTIRRRGSRECRECGRERMRKRSRTC